MDNCPFCKAASVENTTSKRRSTGRLRHAWHSIQWLFPATFLLLIPKCPLCVAAYVALFTGAGITVSTARWIQVLMLALCMSSLTYLILRTCQARRQRVCEESTSAPPNHSAV
jgi:hypothetical protein